MVSMTTQLSVFEHCCAWRALLMVHDQYDNICYFDVCKNTFGTDPAVFIHEKLFWYLYICRYLTFVLSQSGDCQKLLHSLQSKFGFILNVHFVHFNQFTTAV